MPNDEPGNSATTSAADAAIAKAQAKASALANMSDEEKAKAQLDSLKQRLEKAQARLTKAEEENSEHVAAFRAGVEKLQQKINEAESGKGTTINRYVWPLSGPAQTILYSYPKERTMFIQNLLLSS